jgi:hypothetical protein
MRTHALHHAVVVACLTLTAAAAGCSGNSPGGRGPDDPRVVDGTPVTAGLGPEQQAEVARLGALLDEQKDLTADALLARRAVPWKTTAQLGYDPAAAVNMAMIQASRLKLDAAELAALSKNGFVISDKRRYPHFGYGYQTIYSEDLPVFVSADAILQAVHQSYDDILKAIELEALIPQLDRLLAGMRGRLTAATGMDAGTRADADLFLTVALGLLRDTVPPGVAGGDDALIRKLIAGANAASGMAQIALFGVEDRVIDFSQFKPRGHYTDDARLEKYFRAMIWLGRIDFPFIHTEAGTGKQVLVRRAVAAAFALRALLDEAALVSWKRIDGTIRAFVGEPDSMAPPEVDSLKADLGLAGYDVGAVSDQALTAAIVKGAYGKQKILSQIVMQAPHEGAWPLDAVFLFFGQRYVFDSHVFSNVVYDRVQRRMMPNPLDVAYAALGNDQAVALLADDLKKYPYAPALEQMRRLGEEHGDAFWNANLYNLWLGALRALSPTADIAAGGGLPAVARTEAWGRRVLNTQLASWAELRHDTILYAKQSYTTGVACEFPEAYVDPYPAFYAKIAAFAAAGEAVVAGLPLDASSYLGPRITKYFGQLRQVATILGAMAERQRQGMPHTAEQLAFINQAVSLAPFGCGGPPTLQGWYANLFFNPDGAVEFDPTIADVHTQPTDEAGNPVGYVLHVGTGYARLMVTTVDTCQGPRAYAGVVFSYHEVVTEKLQRLDDLEWKKRFPSGGASPDDVTWMRDLVVK